eukprot:3082388-Amphidinium_carterae.1
MAYTGAGPRVAADLNAVWIRVRRHGRHGNNPHFCRRGVTCENVWPPLPGFRQSVFGTKLVEVVCA